MEPEPKIHAEKCPAKDEPVICKCDGYHTFDELYDHRITLLIAVCRQLISDDHIAVWKRSVWRSKLHADGSSYDGWFILGIGMSKGYQISYHLPNSKWEATNFVETLERGPRIRPTYA